MPAYVYLPDDEPDCHQFNGQPIRLRANGTTEIRAYDPSLDAATLERLEGMADEPPTGVVVLRFKQYEPADVARHIADRLGEWGVCVVSGPVVGAKAINPDDQKAVDAAELQYLVGTKRWAEGILLAFAKKSAPLVEAGLPVVDTPEVAKASAWLHSKADALRAAGLA